MVSAINIALSGIRATSLRIENRANNIANAQSSSVVQDSKVTSGPFIPKDIVQVPDVNGGTIAYTKDSEKPPITLYDPDIGTIQLPNVDLAEELVNVQEASFQYKANLKIIDYTSKLLGSLINISV